LMSLIVSLSVFILFSSISGGLSMKLYYSPGSCSMSCHIALEEAGLNYTPVEVDWEKHNAASEELERLNPQGAVPVLVTDQGKALTQNLAILEYIADSKPSSHLLPEAGTWERAEAMRWLSFVASDLHKSFSPFFALESMTSSEPAQAEVRKWAIDNMKGYCKTIDAQLAGKDYLTGKTFTAADAYLFVVAGWSKWVEVSLEEFKNLSAFMSRVYQRPAVQKVLKMEGLSE
jgi:glutathione S-transferase